MWIMCLVIFFTVAMVVGPIMMLRPSPSVTALANMRTRASQLGVSVRMPPRQADGALVKGAIYSLPLTTALRKREDIEHWCLRRLTHSHEIHFHAFWDWEGKGRAGDRIAAALVPQLDKLPEGIDMLELNLSGVGVHWDERRRGAEPEEAVGKILLILQSALSALESA